MYLDPVCRSTLTEKEVKETATYLRKTYHFCCPSCHQEFINNPDTYIGKNWVQRLLFRLEEANAKEYGSKKPSCH